MAVAQSFVVIDLETTDLPRLGETTKITEIAMQSFSRVSLISTKLGGAVLSPRVSNVMVFCLNPEKKMDPISAEMTGLTDEALNMEKKFDKGFCELLKHFLDRLPHPICFVAHNGIRFDFPILQSELSNIGEMVADDILALDSLHVFQDMLPKGSLADPMVPLAANEPPPRKKLKTAAVLKSHKLEDLYKFLVTSSAREDSHSALSDVSALTKCIFSRPQSFLMWADAKVVKFNTIKKMW